MSPDMTDREAHALSTINKKHRPSRVIFFDTETSQNRFADNKIVHELRLGYAAMTRTRRGEQLRVQSDLTFRDPATFWDWVETKCAPKSRLIMVAHNLNFDLPILHAFTELPKRDWELKGFYSKGQVNIFRWAKEDQKIIMLDNGNFFSGKLDKWGDVIGLSKIDVDFESVGDDLLLKRCKIDVEIMRRLWVSWLQFLDNNDLGKFGNTVASTAFNTYRYRFMDDTIFITNNGLALALERASFRGARTEVLFQGYKNHSQFYYVDVNGMYAHVMTNYQYPAGIYDAAECESLNILERKLERYGVIARVQVNVDENPFPLKVDEHTAYPYGRFWTTLTTPELKLALNRGWIEAISHLAWYRQAFLFRDYVNFFTELKTRFALEGNPAWSKIAKLFINSLYGKFGQKGYSQNKIGTTDPATVRREGVYDVDTKEYSVHTYMAGSVIREQRSGEAYNSFPGISAHVTAYARLHLYRLRSLVPPGHVYYMDTDSMIVDHTGLEALHAHMDELDPGMLKIEQESTWIKINAPKDYEMQFRKRQKGIRPEAVPVGEKQFEQLRWKRIPGLIQAGDLDTYYTEEITKTLTQTIHSGSVMESGWVVPPLLLGDEVDANQRFVFGR